MALRVALNRARSQLLLVNGNLRFLGAIATATATATAPATSMSGGCGSIVEQQNYFRRVPSSKQFCRHYFLPPPPARQTVPYSLLPGIFAVNPGSVLSLAEFAVKTHNEDQGGGAPSDGNVQLVRVVRASANWVAELYYITLEAIDEEKGKLNVYFAEVLDSPSENCRQLKDWKLVDQNFNYHFQETRWSKLLLRKICREETVQKNIMTDWLYHMTLQTMMDDKTDTMTGWLDDMALRVMRDNELAKIIARAEGKVNLECDKFLLNADLFPKKAIYPLPAVPNDSTVPIYDIMAYEKVYGYALFAVWTHNKNKDDAIQLEEVLWASKSTSDAGVYYLLLLEAMDGSKELNFYYAVVGVCHSTEDLIEFNQIDESVCNILEKDGFRIKLATRRT